MIDEVDHIMAVMQTAFDPQWGEAWTRKQVTDALVMPHTHAILADTAGNIIASSEGRGEHSVSGFVLSRHAADEEELLLIAVKPELRGTGIGKRLLDAFFQNAAQREVTRVFLEMRANNPAQQLYLDAGFEPIGERRDYYRLSGGGRMNAITFARSLDV